MPSSTGMARCSEQPFGTMMGSLGKALVSLASGKTTPPQAENGSSDRPQPARTRARWVGLGIAGGVVWAAAVIVGMLALWRYASAPGQAATAPELWPAEATIQRIPGLAIIVMAAHPKCPCTRASIAELGKLMARLAGRAHAHVLFMRPSEFGEDWERTDLWSAAAAIPGVTVSSDRDRTQAARFGATTSGQTLVYDAAGQLLFRGGITGARGHVGDNLGVERIVSLLTRGTADRDESAVFGCSLEEPTARAGAN